jgi:hypothetical protein
MADIRIDRLALQAPGLTAADGRRLAFRVADGLAAAGAAGGGREVSALRLDLTAAPGAGVDALAEQIVAEVLRQLRRLL